MKARHEMDPYWTLIDKGLSSRRASSDAMHWVGEHKAPRYVVAMCEKLHRELTQKGAEVSLAEVIRLERTCTGTDYQHKFALRCQRLAVPAAA